MTEDQPRSEDEIARQRDEIVKRMLNTPPQPRPKPKPRAPKTPSSAT